MLLDKIAGKTLTWNSDYARCIFELIANHKRIATYIMDPRKLVKGWEWRPIFTNSKPEVLWDNKKYNVIFKGFFRQNSFLVEESSSDNNHIVKFNLSLFKKQGVFICRSGAKYFLKPRSLLSGIIGGNNSNIVGSTGEILFKVTLKMRMLWKITVNKTIEVSMETTKYNQEEVFQVLLLSWISLCHEEWGYRFSSN